MPAGHFSSLTQLTGYNDDTTSLDIASGGSSKTITLIPLGAILVYARDEHWNWWTGTTYTPRNDVMIRVTCSSPAYDTQISTGSGANDDGYALFSNLKAGTYTVRWGYWDHSHYHWNDSHNITVTAGNTSNFTYTFD
jgi:hypothetical protein